MSYDKAVNAVARELYARDVERNTGGTITREQAYAEWDEFPPDSGPLVEYRGMFREQAQISVEAAAPFIRAEALRDAADVWGRHTEYATAVNALAYEGMLRARADELDPQ